MTATFTDIAHNFGADLSPEDPLAEEIFARIVQNSSAQIPAVAAECFAEIFPQYAVMKSSNEITVYDRSKNFELDDATLSAVYETLYNKVEPMVEAEMVKQDADPEEVSAQLRKFEMYCYKERNKWKATLDKLAGAMELRGRLLSDEDINNNPEVLGIDEDFVFDLSLATTDMVSSTQCIRPRTWDDLTDRRLELDVAEIKTLDPDSPRQIDTYRELAIPDDGVFDGLFTILGYSMLGNNDLGVTPGVMGPGGSGKSELVRLLMSLNPGGEATAEDGYFSTITPSDFASEADPSPQKLVMVGRRITALTEFRSGDRFPSDALKRQNGGGGSTARNLHSRRLRSTRGCTVMFETNVAPDTSIDSGLSRRLRVVPFTQAGHDYFPVAEFLGSAPEGWRRWSETKDRLLVWLAQGYARFRLTNNLNKENFSAGIQEATEQFESSADPFREFFFSHYEITGDEDDFVATKFIAEDYAVDKNITVNAVDTGRSMNELALAGVTPCRKKVQGRKISGFKGVKRLSFEEGGQEGQDEGTGSKSR